jgi:sporulation protein YlmC with PRC-barrel domain
VGDPARKSLIDVRNSHFLQEETDMKKLIIASLAGVVLSTGAAFAQAPQMPATGAAQATKPVTYYTQRTEDHRVSRIIGANVRNNQNDSVGEVEDLIMDRQGNVKAAIISVGGFLGIGERWVAVNYDSLNMMQDGSAWRVVLNATRDQMKTAPEFKYENTWAQRDRASTTATTPRAPVAPMDTSRPVAPPAPR